MYPIISQIHHFVTAQFTTLQIVMLTVNCVEDIFVLISLFKYNFLILINNQHIKGQTTEQN